MIEYQICDGSGFQVDIFHTGCSGEKLETRKEWNSVSYTLTLEGMKNTLTTLVKLLTIHHTQRYGLRIERYRGWNKVQLFIVYDRGISSTVLKQDMADVLALCAQDQMEDYARLLNRCGNMQALEEGKRVHARSITAGFESHVLIINNLINLYSNCGHVLTARKVFDKMSERSVVSWTAMIAGCAQNGLGVEALNLFCQMQRTGIELDRFSFSSVIRATAAMAAIEPGKQIHAHVIKVEFERNVFVGSALVDMYAKCRSIKDARKVFDKMPERNVISWTSMIAGYAQNGHTEESLKTFCEMQRVNMQLNHITYASVLSAFTHAYCLEQGRQVHGCIIKTGLESDVSVGNALVSMYTKCGSIEASCNAFDEVANPNMVSWTAMIAGYVQHEHVEDALELFIQMQRAGKQPNQYTFTSVLKACASVSALEQGKQIHSHAIKRDCQWDVFVGNALVTMYAKCRNLEHAQKIFENIATPNMISYTALIAGYTQNEHLNQALSLFCEMQRLGMTMDHFVFATVVSASASLAALKQGNGVHALIIKTGFESYVFVENALVDMYVKCGNMADARQVFDKIAHRDVISWNAMIAGYTQKGHAENALKLFCQMRKKGMKSDHFTFASVLSASASLAAVEQGKQVHVYTIKTGYESDVSVGNTLVDMYAKGGDILEAQKVFDQMPNQDVVSFNTIISAYAQHGYGREALQFFNQMQWAGIQPNDVTFIGVLSACSHAGLLNEGNDYFISMSRDHGIRPRMEHYACMVDLFCRAGYLDEVENFIGGMPFEPGAVLWRTLLGACRIHGNIELGKRAAEYLLELEPQDAATYVLLSNMYAAAGIWDDAAKVRKLMRDRGVKKEPGQSWIGIKDEVHAFVVEDTLHPQTHEIYAKLESLTWQIKGAGYVPDTNFVLHDYD